MNEAGNSLIEIAFVFIFVVIVILGVSSSFVSGSGSLLESDSGLLETPQILDDSNQASPVDLGSQQSSPFQSP
ncbi:MAG: hypothetical protein H6619_00655 [Deltaproteobacteria bacterium]|nr:hypothetical protein [Deltaproteobacteria bacterium]